MVGKVQIKGGLGVCGKMDMEKYFAIVNLITTFLHNV